MFGYGNSFPFSLLPQFTTTPSILYPGATSYRCPGKSLRFQIGISVYCLSHYWQFGIFLKLPAPAREKRRGKKRKREPASSLILTGDWSFNLECEINSQLCFLGSFILRTRIRLIYYSEQRTC